MNNIYHDKELPSMENVTVGPSYISKTEQLELFQSVSIGNWYEHGRIMLCLWFPYATEILKSYSGWRAPGITATVNTSWIISASLIFFKPFNLFQKHQSRSPKLFIIYL